MYICQNGKSLVGKKLQGFQTQSRDIGSGRGGGQRVRSSIGSNRGSLGGIDSVYI